MLLRCSLKISKHSCPSRLTLASWSILPSLRCKIARFTALSSVMSMKSDSFDTSRSLEAGTKRFVQDAPLWSSLFATISLNSPMPQPGRVSECFELCISGLTNSSYMTVTFPSGSERGNKPEVGKKIRSRTVKACEKKILSPFLLLTSHVSGH